ncbi:tyrosine-type recombinase/integrase [Candidatus Methanocrinis natronophilus]|uniref:Tyrosine-type recombinase/integrase n=1 Tax=Candidatus Methanocrinis natronophilus TaxID=3033396 RepID=A0ABT5XAK5_9EURY|nr:tyrosine-type recombinase/integrase [Candidatus Methanocrinis natronophilus]MDF0591736.1 tyrosine-type recombinase/integrase [Candidatus Methanocrinis natronophilus]
MTIPKLISQEDFEKLMVNLPSERDRLIISLLYGTGARVGELMGAKVGDLDLTEGLLHLQAHKTKTRQYRAVLIPERLLPPLREWIGGREAGGWLFPGQRGGPLSPRRVRQIIAQAAEEAGVQRIYGRSADGRELGIVSPHTLRHLHAVTALDAGVPLNDLQAQLGHSSLSTTSVYLRTGLEHRRRSYARF